MGKKFGKFATMLDLITSASQGDIAIVMPTLDHALTWWPRVQDAMRERFKHVTTSKTAIVIHDTHTVIRLWVPYEKEPTMPLDFHENRRGFKFYDLYGMYGREL